MGRKMQKSSSMIINDYQSTFKKIITSELNLESRCLVVSSSNMLLLPSLKELYYFKMINTFFQDQ